MPSLQGYAELHALSPHGGSISPWYLAICAYDLECNQSLGPVPAHFTSMHSPCNHMAHRWRNLLSASQSSETQSSATQRIVLTAHRDLLPKGSVKHDAMSKRRYASLPITAAITACIIIMHIIVLMHELIELWRCVIGHVFIWSQITLNQVSTVAIP